MPSWLFVPTGMSLGRVPAAQRRLGLAHSRGKAHAEGGVVKAGWAMSSHVIQEVFEG
jgi:hypothetical protein